MAAQLTITKCETTAAELAAVAAAEAAAVRARADAAKQLANRQRAQDSLDDTELRQVLPAAGAPCYELSYTHGQDRSCYLRNIGPMLWATDGASVWCQN